MSAARDQKALDLAMEALGGPQASNGQLLAKVQVAIIAGMDWVKSSPAQSWRCFHCDETFESEKCARLHFGCNEGQQPGCVEKVAGGELGLLRRVREVEQQLVPYLTETSAVEMYVHGLRADHARALRREEEAGYAKGLRDGSRGIDFSDLEERHVQELRIHADKLRWQMTHDERPVPEHGWTCFHCAQTFTTWPSASAHFGDDPIGGHPVCVEVAS